MYSTSPKKSTHRESTISPTTLEDPLLTCATEITPLPSELSFLFDLTSGAERPLDLNQTHLFPSERMAGHAKLPSIPLPETIEASVLWMLAILEEFDLLESLIDLDDDSKLNFNAYSNIPALIGISVFGIILGTPGNLELITKIFEKNYYINYEYYVLHYPEKTMIMNVLAHEETYAFMWPQAHASAVFTGHDNTALYFSERSVQLPYDLAHLKARSQINTLDELDEVYPGSLWIEYLKSKNPEELNQQLREDVASLSIRINQLDKFEHSLAYYLIALKWEIPALIVLKEPLCLIYQDMLDINPPGVTPISSKLDDLIENMFIDVLCDLMLINIKNPTDTPERNTLLRQYLEEYWVGLSYLAESNSHKLIIPTKKFSAKFSKAASKTLAKHHSKKPDRNLLKTLLEQSAIMLVCHLDEQITSEQNPARALALAFLYLQLLEIHKDNQIAYNQKLLRPGISYCDSTELPFITKAEIFIGATAILLENLIINSGMLLQPPPYSYANFLKHIRAARYAIEVCFYLLARVNYYLEGFDEFAIYYEPEYINPVIESFEKIYENILSILADQLNKLTIFFRVHIKECLEDHIIKLDEKDLLSIHKKLKNLPHPIPLTEALESEIENSTQLLNSVIRAIKEYKAENTRTHEAGMDQWLPATLTSPPRKAKKPSRPQKRKSKRRQKKHKSRDHTAEIKASKSKDERVNNPSPELKLEIAPQTPSQNETMPPPKKTTSRQRRHKRRLEALKEQRSAALASAPASISSDESETINSSKPIKAKYIPPDCATPFSFFTNSADNSAVPLELYTDEEMAAMPRYDPWMSDFKF